MFGQGHQALRDELATMSEDHAVSNTTALQALEAQVRKDIEVMSKGHSDTHGETRALLEELDARLCAELSTIGDQHSSHKVAMSEILEKLTQDHAGKFDAHRTDMGSLLRREISRLEDAHRQGQSKHSLLLDDHKEALEKALMEHRAAHEDHKSRTQRQFEDLQASVKKDIGSDSDKHASNFSPSAAVGGSPWRVWSPCERCQQQIRQRNQASHEEPRR
jgi:hypothetical protein